MQTKYIIVDNIGTTKDITGVIIFPEYETHQAMANKFGGAKHVISAGFCTIRGTLDEQGHAITSYACYGESVGLNKRARPEDSKILKKTFEEY